MSIHLPVYVPFWPPFPPTILDKLSHPKPLLLSWVRCNLVSLTQKMTPDILPVLSSITTFPSPLDHLYEHIYPNLLPHFSTSIYKEIPLSSNLYLFPPLLHFLWTPSIQANIHRYFTETTLLKFAIDFHIVKFNQQSSLSPPLNWAIASIWHNRLFFTTWTTIFSRLLGYHNFQFSSYLTGSSFLDSLMNTMSCFLHFFQVFVHVSHHNEVFLFSLC